MKLFTLLLIINTGAFAQTSVGFQSLTRFDASRGAVEEQHDKSRGRIIQINVWYPAEKLKEPMTFRDYVGLAGLELDSARGSDWYELGIERYFAWPQSVKADKNAFETFLKEIIRILQLICGGLFDRHQAFDCFKRRFPFAFRANEAGRKGGN